MNCPHCHCHIDPRKAIGAASSEIVRAHHAKRRERGPAAIKQDRWKRLLKKSEKPVKPGTWAFAIYGEGVKVGGYPNRDAILETVRYTRKHFPEHRWKFILHDPDGNVWIPRRGRIPGEIQYQNVGPEEGLRP